MRKILTASNVAAAPRESVSTMRAMRASVIAAVAVAAVIAGCGGGDSSSAPPAVPQTMRVTSPAFKDGAAIPTKFTCDGNLKGVSPPLAWSRRPAGTKSQALIVTDPDAPGGTFVHWTVWGMMDRTSGLDADIPPLGLPQGKNGAGTSKYAPPCPPKGDSPHSYEFAIYALKGQIDAKPGAPSDEVIDKIKRAALARGVLTGTYGR
jgi:Raf kinase inhibitor-like YbhB/YbcL family protein